jgi:hypothetical protein
MLKRIRAFVKEHLDDIILLVGVILISLLSFAMGYIVAKQQEKEPLRFEMSNPKFLISNKMPNVKIQMPKIFL